MTSFSIFFPLGGVIFTAVGKGGAAKAHDTGLTDDLLKFRRGQRLRMRGRLELHPLFLVVIVNDDRGRLNAAGKNTGLNVHHRAGDGGVDGRRHISARFADQLANLDMVALFDQRLGGCADVLLQRDDNPRRGRKLCDGVMTIDSLAVFALVGVNTPGKQT